jgi:o-succinylbenzoate---CoA ligase
MAVTPDPSVLPDWLRRRAFSTPDRLAVIAPGARWTFAELDRRADAIALRLAACGVSSGDRVAVLLPNRAAFVEIVHALPRIGAVLVPINTRLAPDEIAWQLIDAGVTLLVADLVEPDLARTLRAASPDLKIVALHPGDADLLLLSDIEPAPVKLVERHSATEIHSLIYTSGTTGRPKGALLTYGNHWWSAIGSVLNLGATPDDRWLAVLPLFHVGGLSILQRSVINGIAVVVHETFDPAAVNRGVDEDRVTIVSVVATMLRRMLAERGGERYPPWLRCVLLGGGPAPRPLLEACAARGVPVTQTYGLTETASQVATLAPEDALRKLGSAGKPLYPNELAIEVDGRRAEPGEPGEILVRGPIVTAGYHRLPAATAEALRGGWLHTGDYGYLDADGFLYVLDRRDDLIVSGGENVYPAEVESVLLAHPDVLEAGVIGVSDPEWGQRVVAIVRCHTDAVVDTQVLIAHCRAHLAGYKVPSRIDFTIDPLPRNAGGKLLRRQLRSFAVTRTDAG